MPQAENQWVLTLKLVIPSPVMPAPLPDPLLLPDALGLLHPLLFLGQALLLQAGDALGRRI